jgi:RNA polymerase sigma-54 factor
VKASLQQSPVLRQELRMNPRLYQAMDLLYMPLLDLQQHLKTELENNPFLEMNEEEGEPDEVEQAETEKTSEAEKEDEMDWEDILLDGFSVGGSRMPTEEREFYQPVAVQSSDLADYLRDQLQLLDLDARALFLAEEFVGNIGDDGYLRGSLEEILAGANMRREEIILARGEATPAPPVEEDPLAESFSLEEAERMLAVMQLLDPPGIAARDLRECLLLQLDQDAQQETLTYQLVRDAFEDLVAHRWTEVAKRLSLSPKDIQTAADALARYDPKPGLRFAGSGGEYVVPDLVVDKVDGEYRTYLNDGGMPRLRISPVYRNLASDKSKFVGENREFVTQKLNSASWLIQAIEQRRQTMLRVMYFIIDRQHEFFEKGVEYLRPLTLREVADVLDMHESTVSRVTSQKYVQTPRGVYPLKFFFSSSLGTSSGEDASSRAVKALIQKLVGDEDSSKPLTDADVVRALKERGIKIARRTVAKYREQLNILPARMRKRV